MTSDSDVGEASPSTVIDMGLWEVDPERLASMKHNLQTYENPKLLRREASCCIFRVPQGLIDANGKAYKPSIVSIGPYHRGQPHLNMIQEHKWRYLRSFLSRTGLRLEDLLKAIASLESESRACYSEIIDLKSHDFIEMMVLDGCFIIEFFHRVVTSDGPFAIDDPLVTMEWISLPFYRDIFKLENQIPFIVLQCLFDLSKLQGELSSLALEVFSMRSPLPERVILQQSNIEVMHLLDLVRSSFISSDLQTAPKDESQLLRARDGIHLTRARNGIRPRARELQTAPTEEDLRTAPKDESQLLRKEKDLRARDGILPTDARAGILPTGASGGLQVRKIRLARRGGPRVLIRARRPEELETAPKEEDLRARDGIQLSRARDGIRPTSARGGLRLQSARRPEELQTAPKEEKPKDEKETRMIPCVSMLRLAGIKVKQGKKSESFLRVTFRDGVIEMPAITLDDFTISFLLNCVAFKQCYCGCSKDFTTYVTLLDCLINTSRDVEYLCDRNVIENYLGTEEELARFINNTGKDVVVCLNSCYLSRLFKDVDKYYRNSLHVHLASLKHTYFDTPWSFISAVAAFVLLVLTAAQTYFAAYQYFKQNY